MWGSRQVQEDFLLVLYLVLCTLLQVRSCGKLMKLEASFVACLNRAVLTEHECIVRASV